MTAAKKTKAPVPREVTAAKKLLDEITHLRQEVKTLKRMVEQGNRDSLSYLREIRTLKASNAELRREKRTKKK